MLVCVRLNKLTSWGDDLTTVRSCVLSFSLYLSYGCFPPWKSLLSLCLSVCLAVSLSLCPCLSLSVSLSLTPFSLLRLDHQQRRRVKFSLFSSSFSSSAHSAPVLLVTLSLPSHPSSQWTPVLVCSSPFFAIVHHGTALSQTQPNYALSISKLSSRYTLIYI